MKNLVKKILAPFVLAGALSIGGCDWVYNPRVKDSPQDYTLSNVHKITLGNLNFPNGLSSVKKNNLDSRSFGDISVKAGESVKNITFFTVDPTYLAEGNSVFRTLPAIYGIDELNNVNKIYEFSEGSTEEFRIIQGNQYGELGAQFIVSRGLNLETLALNDNSILMISNISKKLFRIYQDANGVFQKEDYLTDDQLFGTTGMLLEKDGDTVDLVQVPFYIPPTSENLLSISREKRIISFKLSDPTKTLSVRSILPDTFQQITFFEVPRDYAPLYAGESFIPGDKLDIAEDSLGIIYVSDALDKRIYKIENGVASIFKELDRPATSMALDDKGNLFIVKGILLNRDKTIAFNPELFMISSSGNETSVQTLSQNFNYSTEGVFEEIVQKEGQDYVFPTQDFSSLSVSAETPTEIQIDHSDYLGNSINRINAVKTVSP